MQKLHEQFGEWKDQKIDAFELNDRIHQFHQKTAREIWKMYINAGNEDMLVARALKLGILTADEVGQELVEQLGPLIDFWQDGSSDENQISPGFLLGCHFAQLPVVHFAEHD